MPIPKKKPIMKEFSNTGESTNNANTSAENTSYTQSLDAMILDDDILNLDLDDLDLLGEEDCDSSITKDNKEHKTEPKEETVPENNPLPKSENSHTAEKQIEIHTKEAESQKDPIKNELSKVVLEEPVRPQPVEEKKQVPIHYSRRAHRDGYSFKSLTLEEQEMTNYLYISEDVMSSFYFATKRVEEMAAFPDVKYYSEYGYGMPFDGVYLGHIIDCKQSVKRPNSYILKILISATDIRCFNFTPGILDIVSHAITRDLKIRNNVFSSNAYEELAGRIVMFRVQNVESQTGVEYSNFIAFDFINNHEFSVLKKMISIMFNQSQN